ncbi:efflux RND transporter permease subunit [Rhodohalobacter barkolensis]|uniref:AcrB/AcrD/AcrF family protein n=1 Tax=Rhodohalobacter barkolensis TaxID=2053187 RepID=A0A2N0VH72_9BACT|nr:efflux RND transporter permease subunit [Rhodohalobacter barkolensis]PKD43540.1 AcrB/AcrD/AcrF family protein [Rhodohalobacter barkolensis]
MKLTNLTLKNRTVIVVLTAILILAGAFSYSSIPKESNPSIEIPIFIVNTIYPGISPADMESLITQPIERELQGINGVKEIRSNTLESFSSIVVEFDLDVPLSEASQRVRERVDLARTELPPDAEEPFIVEIDLDDFPIMTVNLAADYPLSRLTEVAERLEDAIEAGSGIREVETVGEIEREVQVNVDLGELNGYGLGFGQLVNAIQAQNLTIPGGTVDVDKMSYLLRVSGEFEDPSEIENLVIARPMGEQSQSAGLVYMRDVADVVFGFKDRESFARLRAYKMDENGEKVELDESEIQDNQVISLNIKKRPGANILDTVEEVVEIVEGYPVPSGTNVVITGDQSENVRDLISDLENSIISGMLFVVLVLVFFLGVRNALLVGTAVPLSILVGFIVLYAMGYSANFIILFSLIIALGLLVDNSIVVVENIYRYRELGYERFEAAKLATDEVGYALIAATATLLAAFVPMTFWPGIIGQFMGYLPMTLIVVLLCSLFVALVLYPVLTAYLVRLDDEEKKPMSIYFKGAAIGFSIFIAVAIGMANVTTLVVTVLTILFFVGSFKYIIKPVSEVFNERTFPRILKYYKVMLRTFLKRDYTVKYALLRNSLSLSSLTVALVLGVLGAVIGIFSPASTILYILAGIFGALGVILVIIHSIEAIFIGGKISIISGISLGILNAIILLLVSISGSVSLNVWLVLMSVPLLLVVIGIFGLFRKSSKPLILTDNRSLLLNTVMGALLAIFGMFSLAPTGVEFFPETDPSRIIIELEGPIGMNVEASDEIAKEVQDRIYNLIDEDPLVKANIENLQTNVGVSGDPFFGGGGQSPELSRLTMNLVDFGDRAEPSANTLTKLREIIRDIPDIAVKIEGEEQGPPTGAPVNIEVSGENFDEIVRITEEVTQILIDASVSQSVPGLVDVRNNVSGGTPEYRILVDYEKASRLGLSMSDIAQTIRIANNGLETSKWRDGEDEYDIMVRLRPEDRQDLESLRNLNIVTQMGASMPLVSVASFEEGTGLGSITRLNLQRTATIEGQAAPGFSGPEVLANAQELLSDYRADLPSGYSMEYTGENEEQEEAFGFLTTALMVGFALIFLVMLTKFNSVVSPFIIMVAVGLSLIGVLLGLILTRTPFGLMTFIGIISLAGIVCVNNIVLLDYVKQLTEQGLQKKNAIIEAGLIRFRPVILTALTTILGLVPLTFGINIDFVNLFVNFDPNFQFGSESTGFWGPMGIAIISGLTFATFLTLIVVPVLYSAFDSLAQRLGALKS